MEENLSIYHWISTSVRDQLRYLRGSERAVPPRLHPVPAHHAALAVAGRHGGAWQGGGGAEGGAEGGLHHQPCHQEGAQRLGASAASATQQPQVTDKDS